MNEQQQLSPLIPISHIGAFVAALAVVLVVVLFPVLPSRLKVREGVVASQTIRAPREVRYDSEVLRRQRQAEAVKNVTEVTRYDVAIKGQQLARLTEIINRINGQLSAPGFTRQARDDGIARIQGVNLTPAQRGILLDFSAEQWFGVANESTRLLGATLEFNFPETAVEDQRASARIRVLDGYTALQGEIVVALVQPLVVATQRRDDAKTEADRQRAAAAVEPQQQYYARGQVIVREGDVIDETRREALREAGVLTPRLRWEDLASATIMAVMLSAALGFYLRMFQPAPLAAMRRLLATLLLVVGLAVTAKLYLPLILPDADRHYLAFVLPVAAVPMLAVALFEVPFAIVLACVSSMLVTFAALYLPERTGVVGLSTGQPLQMCASYLFGGLAGVMVMYRAERLNRYLVAAAAVSVASFLGALAFWPLDEARSPIDLAWMGGASVAAGLSASVLTVGLVALLGSAFGVTTRLQLMELAQFNAPLLRRLQDEAPGTFHHSILVGNLAERAADRIGADSLLVRVGAYYHDIGKLARPAFFAENQLSGENPHDQLDPVTSTRILQDHVEFGVELARRHRLPDRVRACIQEHHGTLRTAYFYRKAAQLDPEVDPQVFTYAGPRPGSRETALVMLADSCEASVRASKDKSPEAISRIVETIIVERMGEGQFDDCPLTLRDLRLIAESFKHNLRAIYHPRVEYP